jgi:hypothetical protein
LILMATFSIRLLSLLAWVLSINDITYYASHLKELGLCKFLENSLKLGFLDQVSQLEVVFSTLF